MRWGRTLVLAMVLGWMGAGCGPTETAVEVPVPEEQPGPSEPPPSKEPPEEHPSEDPPPACLPIVLSCEGKSCGVVSDGCNSIDCGTCAEGEQCVGHVCTPREECVPKTCHMLMATCGEYPDGCGGTLQCGTCAEGEVCGAILPRTCGQCSVTGDLGSALPVQRAGTPSGGWAGSGYGRDVRDIYQWTAPRTGTYVIGNLGSGPESWMKVGLDACGWTPAPGPTPEHPNRYHLEEGQSVYISVFGDSEWLGWLVSYFHLGIANAATSEHGLCTDRLDNDGDGKLDCWDPDCGGSPECEVDACTDVKLGNALPLHATLPKGLGHDLFKPDCGPKGRDERVVSWTAPEPGKYVFHARGNAYGISLRSGCLGEQLACAAGYDIRSYTPVVVREMTAKETILIVLQGSKGNDDLPFGIPEELFIHEWVPIEGEGLCEDGLDNDGDGLIDFRDPSCPNHSD